MKTQSNRTQMLVKTVAKPHFQTRVLAAMAGLALLGGGCTSEKEIHTAKMSESPSEPILEQAAAKPPAPFDGAGWKSLFDGKTLAGWQVTDFAGHGTAACKSGLIVIESGAELSGINWTNEVPRMNYEVALDAMKLEGPDFFCGLTFPVGKSYCSLILGGWGGSTVGLSSIDDEDAAENETSTGIRFDKDRWYRVRVRVTDAKIEAWLDEKKIVDLKTTGRKIGLRFGEIEDSVPLGLATYETRAAMREIKIRVISPPSP